MQTVLLPQTNLPPQTNPEAIRNWIESARKGDSYDYHYGYLPTDSDQRRKYGREVADNGAAAWQAYESGKVTLVQRKSAEYLYTYRMQRL